MAFIHNIVGPDEKLLGIARLHWIYAVRGLAWLVGLIFLGGFIKLQMASLLGGALAAMGNAVFWICLLLGIVLFTIYIVMMLFTELGLTTKRCIYKRGWIFVDVREVDLEEVKSASIDSGVFGRILNYGYIHLDARFIDDIGLPAIKDPYRFIKALNDMRSDIKNDSMRVVIDQGVIGKGVTPKQKKEDQKQDEQEPHHLNDDEYNAFSDDISKNTRGLMHDTEDDIQPEKHVLPEQNPKSDKGKKIAPSAVDKDKKQEKNATPTVFDTGKKKEKSENKTEKKAESSSSQDDADNNSDPLNKTMREHLKEEILDDFEEAENVEAAAEIAKKS